MPKYKLWTPFQTTNFFCGLIFWFCITSRALLYIRGWYLTSLCWELNKGLWTWCVNGNKLGLCSCWFLSCKIAVCHGQGQLWALGGGKRKSTPCLSLVSQLQVALYTSVSFQCLLSHFWWCSLFLCWVSPPWTVWSVTSLPLWQHGLVFVCVSMTEQKWIALAFFLFGYSFFLLQFREHTEAAFHSFVWQHEV